MDNDFENYEKFAKSIGDIKSHGILNAVMLNRDLTEKEAIAKILEMSTFVKKHYTTAQYNAEFLKTSAEYLSGIRMKELEVAREIYDASHSIVDLRYVKDLVSNDFLNAIYNDAHELCYEKLAHVIELGNKDVIYYRSDFNVYKVINEHHKIEMAFQDEDTIGLSEQVNELHARYEELTAID